MYTMLNTITKIKAIPVTQRVQKLRLGTLNEPHRLSVEQAKIITDTYRTHKNEPRIIQRAWALRAAMENITIHIADGELIVGNRSKEIGAGVVFPEGGIGWLTREIDTLETRSQDQFLVRPEDKEYFESVLVPFWQGMTLEDNIYASLSQSTRDREVVGKLNQKDHAQGHICPDVKRWLDYGPSGLLEMARERLDSAPPESRPYYQATILVLEGAVRFIARYAELAEKLAMTSGEFHSDYNKIARICTRLTHGPAESFHEALQMLWFLFVLLQMESNASSFSPGRVDQYLYPYFIEDCQSGKMTLSEAQELIDVLFIKFNQIVYMRNADDAAFFAGFPIGFNMAIGGQLQDGSNAENELTHLFLHAQSHVRMRQPNLSARVYEGSSQEYLTHVTEVIALGTGMPQLFNDEAVIPALESAGYSEKDARNYAVVGCVELSTQGNALGFSDAGMFNLVKVLELTLNNGVDMQTGKQIGLPLGTLEDFKTFEELEAAFAKQIDYFLEIMEAGLKVIERIHRQYMPSPLLSSVIDDCLEKGVDVTAGGAVYNKSGIQLIQIANVADSMAALKHLLYDQKKVSAAVLLHQLPHNYPDEKIRQIMLTHAPKYGNDVEWVDEIGEKWVEYFKERLSAYSNYRGGNYTIGLYTVSAHVPMGRNVAATPDGRRNKDPLADGGLSAVYGRDQNGPSALLRSVSRIRSINAPNGTLLNMKFSPKMFESEEGIKNFCALICGFIALKITHVQFNVVNKADLIAAKTTPENYRHLLVRVAGYTANYVDLNPILQDEIIARTEYGSL
jgi:pyruvate formate-lyase/glycerol dehydratase family glycyl radical enzyme